MHKLNPITKSIWLTLLLAGGGVSEGLLAAETTEADSKTTTEPSLKTVTVTAQHREETLQEVPVAVSAVQGTSLVADGVRNMGDITTFVPNASAKNPDGDGRPRWYIRGLGTGDTGAATVYPVGVWKGTTTSFGNEVNFPIPFEEGNNPNFSAGQCDVTQP